MIIVLVSPDDACADPGFLPCGGNVTQCIPKNWFCDGRHDCPNGRDEECCRKFGMNNFTN